MGEAKTRRTPASVDDFLDAVPDPRRRGDAREVAALMQEITGEPPALWGSNIVGFGSYHYRYASGREGDWALTGFSPRAQALAVYVVPGFQRYDTLMQKLGKYKTGKSCLYLKSLDDIDRQVLRELIAESVAYMRRTYPASD